MAADDPTQNLARALYNETVRANAAEDAMLGLWAVIEMEDNGSPILVICTSRERAEGWMAAYQRFHSTSPRVIRIDLNTEYPDGPYDPYNPEEPL